MEPFTFSISNSVPARTFNVRSNTSSSSAAERDVTQRVRARTINILRITVSCWLAIRDAGPRVAGRAVTIVADEPGASILSGDRARDGAGGRPCATGRT